MQRSGIISLKYLWGIITPVYQQLQHMHFARTLKLNIANTPSLHNLHFHGNVSAFDNQMLRFESQMPELNLYWTLGGGYNLPTSAWFRETHTEMRVFIEQMVIFWNVTAFDLKYFTTKKIICSSNDAQNIFTGV